MPKIKLKYISDSKTGQIETALLLKNHGIKIHDIIPIKIGFIVCLNEDEDHSKFFSNKIIESLNKIGLQPIETPQVIAKKTVYVKKCSDLVIEELIDDIKCEIENQNKWIKISKIFAFGKTKTLKITFNTIEISSKVKERGFLMFNLSIPSYIIHEKNMLTTLCSA